jgi:hypothetical protein
MKKIKLTQGKYALVDDEDFEWVNYFKWQVGIKYKGGYRYASTTHKKKGILMHRFIMKAVKGIEIDHIDGNTFNNQRKNLRFCNRSDNMKNRIKQSNSTSPYKGVGFRKDTQKWFSRISIDGVATRLGQFLNAKEAAHAYNKAAKKYYGKFAKLNLVDV